MDFKNLLHRNGLRATEGRIHILETLAKEKNPITVEKLKKKLSNNLDAVTLYRALEALRETRIVERVDLQHGHAHYELIVGRPHHHHAVCRSCGTIEDIEIPHIANPEKEAERKAKMFARIDSYSLEFFGLCVNCA